MKIPNKKSVAVTAATFLFASAAWAADVELTIVSWGGAYSTSQQNAYHEPYMQKTGAKIVNDDSSNEGVAKLRAMQEAGNTTWDLVDVVAADAIRLCDEGLALEIDHDKVLAPAPDGTPASKDMGDLIVSECFIPQIVIPRLSAIAPMSPNGEDARPKPSPMFLIWKNFRASGRWKSAPSTI